MTIYIIADIGHHCLHFEGDIGFYVSQYLNLIEFNLDQYMLLSNHGIVTDSLGNWYIPRTSMTFVVLRYLLTK